MDRNIMTRQPAFIARLSSAQYPASISKMSADYGSKFLILSSSGGAKIYSTICLIWPGGIIQRYDEFVLKRATKGAAILVGAPKNRLHSICLFARQINQFWNTQIARVMDARFLFTFGHDLVGFKFGEQIEVLTCNLGGTGRVVYRRLG